ncbi:flagellar protein FlaG [Gorillibacterium sp. CAU 1737]|uniref:flagellar protein FlaG n=1 Tax=Gorillibacterium sp. CAU 1737 TaxID=3140362 RepID=UPI0032600601
MSANDLSITGTGAATSVDRTMPIKPVKVNVSEAGNNTGKSIGTVKELKQAELSGENISISDEQLIRSIERAIKAMEGASTQLDFSIHGKTKQIMVKVLDKESGKIIREIPPEKTLDFVAKMWEMAGILVDERR